MHVNMIEMKASIDVMLIDFIKEFDRLIIKLVHSFTTDLLCRYFFTPLAFLGEDGQSSYQDRWMRHELLM